MAQSLKTLLEGIYGSVLAARRHVNAQHLDLFESYFERRVIPDPDTGQQTEVYMPRLVAMATSQGVGAAESFEVFEAPAITLIPLSTLAIDSLEIEFEARLSGLDVLEEDIESAKSELAGPTRVGEVEDEGIIRRTLGDMLSVAGDISIMMKSEDFDSSTPPAKVKVVFKLHNAPEGAALIQEQLLDYLRK